MTSETPAEAAAPIAIAAGDEYRCDLFANVGGLVDRAGLGVH
jgi:hypothetical protein